MNKFKSLFKIICVAVVAVLFIGCSSDDDRDFVNGSGGNSGGSGSIVGIWLTSGADVFAFNEGGTGSQAQNGNVYPFNYTINGTNIMLNFYNGSVIETIIYRGGNTFDHQYGDIFTRASGKTITSPIVGTWEWNSIFGRIEYIFNSNGNGTYRSYTGTSLVEEGTFSYVVDGNRVIMNSRIEGLSLFTYNGGNTYTDAAGVLTFTRKSNISGSGNSFFSHWWPIKV